MHMYKFDFLTLELNTLSATVDKKGHMMRPKSNKFSKFESQEPDATSLA